MNRTLNNYQKGRAIRRTWKQLIGLPDRQLADIGISKDLLSQGDSIWPWQVGSVESVESAGSDIPIGGNINGKTTIGKNNVLGINPGKCNVHLGNDEAKIQSV